MEDVWNESFNAPSSDWEGLLRSQDSRCANPVATAKAVETAGKRLRPGRAHSIDMIPSEIITSLKCVLPLVTLLFTTMLQWAVYPGRLGVALIRAIFKLGKPSRLPTSLRGIQLLGSLASWFGQVLDKRTRTTWQAGPDQFGFRPGVGCMEALSVLLALIGFRTTQRRRLFILWVDVHTTFPSINRSILVHRLFLCGFKLGFCRIILTISDLTRSILCICNLVGEIF